jgi:hypothetical protein
LARKSSGARSSIAPSSALSISGSNNSASADAATPVSARGSSLPIGAGP